MVGASLYFPLAKQLWVKHLQLQVINIPYSGNVWHVKSGELPNQNLLAKTSLTNGTD